MSLSRTNWPSARVRARRVWRLARLIRPGDRFVPNARRLCQRPDIRERVAELAAQGAELAGINAGWVLEALSRQARASLGTFMARDEQGNIIRTSRGDPLYDFSRVSDDDLRTLKEIKLTRWGPQSVLHDPQVALDRLGRYLGLWSGEAVAVSNASASAEAKAEASIDFSKLSDEQLDTLEKLVAQASVDWEKIDDPRVLKELLRREANALGLADGEHAVAEYSWRKS